MTTKSLSPFGERTQKYWDRRHSLFSKWDEGIMTDEEGLFSVKPEKFALEIAQSLPGELVLDAFCGIGGSAIGFALCGKRVISVDLDENRLRMAKHNADIYGVADKIEFVRGDVTALYASLFETRKFDTFHVDPPWGGPDYSKKQTFGWADFAPNPLSLVQQAIASRVNVAVGLPVNFAQSEMRGLPIQPHITEARDETRILFRTAYFLRVGK